MFHRDDIRRAFSRSMGLTLLALALAPMVAIAGGGEKTYPLTGKVIGMGQNQTQIDTQVGSRTVYFHTYKVETDSRVYDLDCERAAMIHSTGKQCGGDQPLDIGSVIHFRTEKGKAYLLLPDGKEQKLRILSEDAKPEPKASDK
jgi:hypothetical protein